MGIPQGWRLGSLATAGPGSAMLVEGVHGGGDERQRNSWLGSTNTWVVSTVRDWARVLEAKPAGARQSTLGAARCYSIPASDLGSIHADRRMLISPGPITRRV